LPVLLIAGLTATASATVFVMYYGSATASVQSADVLLAAGSDASASCNVYPCATVTFPTTGPKDFATVGISFFASHTQTSPTPQPETYYTNLLQVANSANSHTINSVQISNVVDSSSVLGSITVYYCTTQTNSPATSANCASYAITSAGSGPYSLTGNSVLPQTFSGAGTSYIEVVAYANAAASSGTVTFQVGISWV